MPTLALPHNGDGVTKLAYLELWAVMLFPTDEHTRLAWAKTQHARLEQTLLVQLPWLDTLLPLATSTLAEKEQRAVWQGAVAGDILQLIASMSYAGVEGSLRKAVDVLLTCDYQQGLSMTGLHVPHNATQIRQAWTAYKSVAHLWAAYRHADTLRRTPAYVARGGIFKDDLFAFEMPRLFFLSLAESYRQFGINYPHRQRQTQPSLLADTDTWIVHTATEPPWLLPEQIAAPLPALPLTRAQKQALAEYQANPNRSTREPNR